MDDGTIVINGIAGDVIGYAMRGGKVLIKGDVGYRVGIHMKAYKEKTKDMVDGVSLKVLQDA
jgi:glutamate synthase domain-containing protein 3